VEDRRGNKVGTVGEPELGDGDLRAEDDRRGIGYVDRDGDTGEIRDQGGPDWAKVGGGCSVGGLLGGSCRRGRIEVATKKSELFSFLKKFDARFRSKGKLPITY
jgi:hypothetical protein